MPAYKRYPKFYLVLLLGLCLLAVALLSISFPQLEFNPARYEPPTYSLFEQNEAAPQDTREIAFGSPAELAPLVAPEQTLMLSIVVGVLVFASAITKEGRHNLIFAIIKALIFGLCFYYIAPHLAGLFSDIFFGNSLETVTNGELAPSPEMPDRFRMLVSLAIASLLTLLVWRLYKRFRPKPSPPPIDFTAQAQQSLDALDAGDDLRDTIIRCYRAMLLQAKQADLIADDQTATTLDFENTLISYGLPKHETERLTRLFEAVRYGSHKTSERERLEARDCLSTFIASCQRQFGRNQVVTN